MKKNPPELAAGDARTEALRLAPPIPFRITALSRVSYGSKCAELCVETPIGVVELDVFRPEGREAFVQARSVRDKFTGQWRRTIALDRAFAERVLDALRERNAAAKQKPPPQNSRPGEPSEVLLRSERRFDSAFAELENESAL